MKFLFFLAASILSFEAAAAGKVLVWPIEAWHSGRVISCSSTLMLVQEEVKLLTNAHCVHGASQITLFVLGPAQAQGAYARYSSRRPMDQSFFGQKIPLKLLKLDLDRDLAQLEVPGTLLAFKDHLTAVSVSPQESLHYQGANADHVRHLSSWGHVQKRPRQYFSNDISWEEGIGNSSIAFLATGKKRLPYLAQAHSLKVDFGMSGGAVLSFQSGLVGLIKGLLPYQHNCLIIALEDVLLFLNDQTLPIPSPQEQNHQGRLGQYYGAAIFHNHSGQMLAGDNSHADGGEVFDERFWGRDLLALFAEPAEGIPCPFERGQIITGTTDGDDYFQVDGQDDYLLKVVGRTDARARIHRQQNGPLPDRQLREEILERLASRYSDLLSSNGPQHIVLLEDPTTPERFKKIASGNFPMNMELSEDQLSLDFWSHPLSNFSLSRDSLQMDEARLVFKVQKSSDSSVVLLTNRQFRFVCKNKYLLKLICEDQKQQAGLALSLSDTTAHGQMRFRFYQAFSHQGKLGVNFYYGSLKKDSR